MKEKEYVDATNLAKVRCAVAIVREVNTLNEGQNSLRQRALTSLLQLQDLLEKLMKVTP